MKTFVTVILFSVLLVAFTEANWYGKRGSEGGLRDIIGVMKLREQTRESAEGLLAQIDELIQTWKARQGLSKRSVPDN